MTGALELENQTVQAFQKLPYFVMLLELHQQNNLTKMANTTFDSYLTYTAQSKSNMELDMYWLKKQE